MKYALTLNFETKEDLQAFLDEGSTSSAESTTIAATAPKKKAPAAKAKVEDVMVDVGPLPEAPKAPATIFPSTGPVPQPAPAAPLFDRNLAIAHVTATINELTGKGVQGSSIAALCANIYSKMNHPITKVGELNDQALQGFLSHFGSEVNALVASMQAPSVPQSFI